MSHPKQKRPRLRGEERAVKARDLRDRYEGGSSIRGLVSLSGLSYATVRVLLLEAGTRLRPRGGPRTSRIETGA
ncbi:helix-turn-helix domain-containing protein [Streptomyces echinoruber]|uniref:Helix-turn-helix domain-containing protein n=1 Tax=Streptomyces echinoruber TaxID=68898 RepID=A0A918QU49_9ACTN|nr:helix-turn-helix domain-containing protein [Streptomyces echinoruber]GGZ72902.1 hypothetical protein GCM10010389_07850 [Streptomyces echinoruber]